MCVRLQIFYLELSGLNMIKFTDEKLLFFIRCHNLLLHDLVQVANPMILFNVPANNTFVWK